ncbi:MAG: alpha/beta hydrolase, partial [Anaerolineae bacterium]|nr:alpha/beta hydrolase [Anaerolineae bacterium]
GFFQLPWLPEWALSRNHWRAATGLLVASGRRDPQTGHTLTWNHAEDFPCYIEAWSQPGAITGMLNWYRAILRCPPRPLTAPRVHVETLIIWGRQDIALSESMAQSSLGLCDDGRLEMFDEASHWVQHDRLSEVSRLLTGWFSGPAHLAAES